MHHNSTIDNNHSPSPYYAEYNQNNSCTQDRNNPEWNTSSSAAFVSDDSFIQKEYKTNNYCYNDSNYYQESNKYLSGK